MSDRFMRAQPLLWTTLLLATGGAPLYWPLGLAVIALLSVVLPWRLTLTTFGALLWMIAGASLPIFWARTTTSDIGLALPVALLLSGVAAVRLFFETPLFGRNFDRALVGFVCIAEGIGVKSAPYPYVAVIVAVSLLVESAGGLAALRAFARTPRAAMAVVALSVALASLLAIALPAIDRATNRRFQALFEGRIRKTAFSAHVRLDQPGLISSSDEIVLRLHGAEADYLRGAVFDSFDGAYWTTSPHGAARATVLAPPAKSDRTEVDAAESSVWLFAPRGTVAVGDTPWEADALGARRPTERRGALHWAFATAMDEPVDAPTDADRKLPPSIVDQVRPLAREWTAGATNDRERVDALASHLMRDFTYTLDRPAPPAGSSALIDFLFVHREGHCEFFASAFVVLARTLGIPARLVAGFRVVEHNGFGGYAVVRAKHAHAWAEAWVPAGDTSHFEVVDPTPGGVPTLEQTNTRSTSAFFDYLKWSIGALYDAAIASPERSIPVLLGIIVIAFIVRAVRNRRRRKDSSAEAIVDVLPASFVRFETMLAEQGFVRERAETLESLASRLAAADHEAWAKALRRYARVRYGPGTASDTDLAEALTTER